MGSPRPDTFNEYIFGRESNLLSTINSGIVFRMIRMRKKIKYTYMYKL